MTKSEDQMFEYACHGPNWLALVREGQAPVLGPGARHSPMTGSKASRYRATRHRLARAADPKRDRDANNEFHQVQDDVRPVQDRKRL